VGTKQQYSSSLVSSLFCFLLQIAQADVPWDKLVFFPQLFALSALPLSESKQIRWVELEKDGMTVVRMRECV